MVGRNPSWWLLAGYKRLVFPLRNMKVWSTLWRTPCETLAWAALLFVNVIWNTCLGLSWFGRKWQENGWKRQQNNANFSASFSQCLAIFCQTKTAQGKCFIWRSQATKQPRPVFHFSFLKLYSFQFHILQNETKFISVSSESVCLKKEYCYYTFYNKFVQTM